MFRIVAALIAVVSITVAELRPADAAVRIQASTGGRIIDYLTLFAAVRESGEQVIIDGPCLSACTLVLSVVPRSRVCVTSRAVLGFHAARAPGRGGKLVRHAGGTKLLMDLYPPNIRSWIASRGGLKSNLILLRGRELTAIVQPCG